MSFIQGMGPLALAPMFDQLMEAFHSSLASVVQFTGVCILVLGFSNFLWYPNVPFPLLYSRKLTSINIGFRWLKHSVDAPWLYSHLLFV